MTASLTPSELPSFLDWSRRTGRLPQLDRLLTATPANLLLGWLRDDPVRILCRAGLTPDPWQADTLRSAAARVLLLCARQAGKSTVAAGLALREALLTPGSLVLLLSPTLRQS